MKQSRKNVEFLKLAQDRFSVRDFSSREVEEEKIMTILEAAKAAPTAVNYQPQKLYVVRTPEAVARLTAIRPLFGAPMQSSSATTTPYHGITDVTATMT